MALLKISFQLKSILCSILFGYLTLSRIINETTHEWHGSVECGMWNVANVNGLRSNGINVVLRVAVAAINT